eukprot:10981165-Karenia_brevis.AAC.1
MAIQAAVKSSQAVGWSMGFKILRYILGFFGNSIGFLLMPYWVGAAIPGCILVERLTDHSKLINDAPAAGGADATV